MDINDLHPADDHTNRFFIWHEWIQANGLLTVENVLEYFSYSMFYDKQSNNQVLRMQTMHTGMPVENEAEELRRFTGIEFALVHAQPPTFFIIQKRERLSPDEVRPLAAYFIMNNRIYQSPDLYSVVSNRLLTTVSSLQASLDILRKHRPDYTPRSGFVWPVVGDPNPDSEASKKKGPSEEVDQEGQPSKETTDAMDETADATGPVASTSTSQAATSAKRPLVVEATSNKRVNTMLLMNAMRTTAMNSKISSPSSAALVAESVTAETPSTSQVRSSVTPAPSTQGESTAKGTQGESSKAAGKKRRKRSSVAQT
ncbi:hypothetical protein D9611_003217 [Ephemerocybe angulata]|uniref:Mediator of RNA polymerase II transcription subunit 6 n=2 Tax=Ephemerocybe angulata TaxID=980116 RepID=A0A8H5FH87_9AGAR|nr:hypothetical protein D9611_003217 [Tulosesus angulatus]KAF6766236.1 MED6-domain-containing protein [Tulosesus angulatus]